MGRPTRTASGAAWHHVMNRGARRLSIFGDDDDRQFFLECVGEGLGADARLHAYVLMGNHYHLLLESRSAQLGAVMKFLGENYTRRFNSKYGLDGPLFRGRYRSEPIEDERYLLTVLRYIHRNPMEGGIGGLDYAWSSHGAYVGERRAAFLTTDHLLECLGSLENYRRVVEEGEASDLGRSFGERSTVVRPGTPRAVEWALGLASPAELDLVRFGGGPRRDARAAVVFLAAETTSQSSTQLAERYGYSSGGSVRAVVARTRNRLNSDPVFAKLVEDGRLRLRYLDRKA